MRVCHSLYRCAQFIEFVGSIVEFASPEDAQRAVRELSEQALLGRPVFIREVSSILRNFSAN
jgi:RNA recognition motif-containing protein